MCIALEHLIVIHIQQNVQPKGLHYADLQHSTNPPITTLPIEPVQYTAIKEPRYADLQNPPASPESVFVQNSTKGNETKGNENVSSVLLSTYYFLFENV